MTKTLSWYQGNGTNVLKAPPPFEHNENLDAAEHYIASARVRHAVNVAIALGVPLLVTGDPGTGKTQLAWSVAHELNAGEPLVFSAKTTSTAQDLFYQYDALGHFRAARLSNAETSAWPYINAEAFGIAILRALPPAEYRDQLLPPALRGAGPARSVVLIDEIDKAPRDLPNDILREIKTMSFVIREVREQFPAQGKVDKRFRPIVIITSNSEKNLPDAFLRRCVFVHIAFPGAAQLEEIVKRRFADGWLNKGRRSEAIAIFERIRALPLKKKPATAEFLAWLHILHENGIEPRAATVKDSEALAHATAILAKDKDDVKQVMAALTAS